MNDAAIKVDNVSKDFRLPHEKYSSVKSLFVNFYRAKRTYELHHALKGITFEVNHGEFFGIVGRNGSGKSTLLKLMAGIYIPTSGEIKVNGSLTPFIELGVGFNPELTGRENVYLNGALLGIGRKQMKAMYKDIVDFAELGKFMDQKLKNYSSGMQVRLAFSIAIRARSDILLLDEVLAVGDAAFQQKCYDYFSDLKKQRKTIILVSHNMSIIEQYCDRAMLIEDGQIKKIGPSDTIARMYDEMFLKEELERIRKDSDSTTKQPIGPISVVDVKVLQHGEANKYLQAKKGFEVEVVLKSDTDFESANVGINIKNRDRNMLVSTDTFEKVGGLKLIKEQKKTVRFKIENILTDGLYTVNLGIADNKPEVPKMLYKREHVQEFTVSGVGPHALSLTHPKISIEID